MARGSKPGERRGGRTKGQPNRKNAETIQKAASHGIMPLDVMLEAMMAHYNAGNLDEAHLKAKDAAPYVHPKLASVDNTLKGPDGGPVRHEIEMHIVDPKQDQS